MTVNQLRFYMMVIVACTTATPPMLSVFCICMHKLKLHAQELILAWLIILHEPMHAIGSRLYTG